MVKITGSVKCNRTSFRRVNGSRGCRRAEYGLLRSQRVPCLECGFQEYWTNRRI